ncbi:hypothetical protein HJC23_014056 [Cyclotella cryptica]|uniref:Uncharacterized protein n=1 Tax=Cyclotella cryptica TaxID=29204 RepID=A0ABD3QST4_9STRA
MPALAMSRTRNESNRQHKQLHVHFKHPIEEDEPMITRVKKEYMRKSKSLVDPLVQRHAKEIIAAKLIEGYYLKGNGEKCTECLMPLMVKDSAWDGVFCGQGWYQSQKTGVCVVCNPEPYDDESNASDDLLESPRGQYQHCIPSFPEDDQSDDGSVDQFKKKFAISTEVHAKKSEMKEEEDEIAVAELNVHVKPGDSKYCPSCGMEMLYFEQDLECPFCAVELVKQELGIAGFQADAIEYEKMKEKNDVVDGLYLNALEIPSSSSCSTLSESVRFAELHHDEVHASQRDDGVISTPEKSSHETSQKHSSISYVYEEAPAVQVQSEAGSTELAVNAILKRLIAGFWKENNDKSSQGASAKHSLERRPSSASLNEAVESFSAKESASVEVKDEEEDNLNALNQNTANGARDVPDERDVEENDVDSLPSRLGDTGECSETHGPSYNGESANEIATPESTSPECRNSEDKEEVASVTSKLEDMDLGPNASYDFAHEESALFDDDHSNNDALSEVVTVARNILAQRDLRPNDTAPDVSTLAEEKSIRSRMDPPSVCSRDPPNLVTNTDELVEDDLLLLRKNHSSPDSRDPPMTFSDKYQPKLEFMYPEPTPFSCAGRNPIDPSEHGGSLDLDSFSQEDIADVAHRYHFQTINEVEVNYEPENPPRDVVPSHCKVTAPCKDPPDLVTNSTPVTTTRKIDGGNATRARRNTLYRQPDILKKMNHGVGASQSMKPDPMAPVVVKPAPPRAEDLYQQPDILKSMLHEHESSRDKIVRQRLIQLESRYQKLTSPRNDSGSQSITSESHQNSHAKSIFKKPHSNFDTVDLHKSISVSEVSSWNVRENGPGLSSSAIARHEHYKKELHAREKNSINPQSNNDVGTCLSPTAVQRRRHYKEVLKVQMAQQGSRLATQE